jgi:hypothetical protein
MFWTLDVFLLHKIQKAKVSFLMSLICASLVFIEQRKSYC